MISTAESSAPSSKKTAKRKSDSNTAVTIRSGSLAQAKAELDGNTAEVMIGGLPKEEGQTPAERSYVQITTADGKKSERDLECLFCRTKID